MTFQGAFADFELPLNSTGESNLQTAGFKVFGPEMFFQTLPRTPAFSDAAKCQQWDRQFVNRGGNNGCSTGYYFNDAALCAPCSTTILRGDTCSPCGGGSPFRINVKEHWQCVG